MSFYHIPTIGFRPTSWVQSFCLRHHRSQRARDTWTAALKLACLLCDVQGTAVRAQPCSFLDAPDSSQLESEACWGARSRTAGHVYTVRVVFKDTYSVYGSNIAPMKETATQFNES